jgi:4-amino-4-deoxy-L-arabinose transferase-like glycosyltransferase
MLNKPGKSDQLEKPEKRMAPYLLLLLVTVIPLFGLGLSNHGLWTADEPRVGEIGREMAISGNWAVPTLNKKPFLEEPPLYYASLAVTFKLLGGASDKVARIPSALFALGGVVALFLLGSMLFSPRIGFLSGFILATGGEYFRVAHWLVVDSALACFVITAMAFFMAGYRSDTPGKRLLSYILCYTSCTLAFYSKGFIGIAIPGLGMLAFIIFDRNLKELLRMRLWLGILVFSAMAMPWFLALWYQGGAEYLRVYLVYNHLQRFLPGGASGHHQPFYYYLTEFPTGFLPWSLLLVPVVCFCIERPRKEAAGYQKGLLFAGCWFLTGLVFLSLASTKRALYLMPIFAPIALLTACYIDTTLESRVFHKVEKIFLWVFGCTPLLVGLMCVPLYLFAVKLYSIGSSSTLLATVISVSLLTVLLSLVSLGSLVKRQMERFWIYSGAALFSLLIFALVVVVPILDLYKSLVPFCQQVKNVVATDAALYAYQPDETLRGALPFYTGYHPKEVEDIKSLEDILAAGNQIFVAIRDSHRRLEKELLSTGRLMVLRRQDIGTDRSLVLFTTRVTGKPDTTK